MTPPKDETPAGQGEGFERQTNGDGLHPHSIAMRKAAATALIRELWIILQAAKQLAAGYGLSGKDNDRLHQAHQHVMATLSVLTDREVLL